MYGDTPDLGDGYEFFIYLVVRVPSMPIRSPVIAVQHLETAWTAVVSEPVAKAMMLYIVAMASVDSIERLPDASQAHRLHGMKKQVCMVSKLPHY